MGVPLIWCWLPADHQPLIGRHFTIRNKWLTANSNYIILLLECFVALYLPLIKLFQLRPSFCPEPPGWERAPPPRRHYVAVQVNILWRISGKRFIAPLLIRPGCLHSDQWLHCLVRHRLVHILLRSKHLWRGCCVLALGEGKVKWGTNKGRKAAAVATRTWFSIQIWQWWRFSGLIYDDDDDDLTTRGTTTRNASQRDGGAGGWVVDIFQHKYELWATWEEEEQNNRSSRSNGPDENV